jgi:hypothetical protein
LTKHAEHANKVVLGAVTGSVCKESADLLTAVHAVSKARFTGWYVPVKQADV